MYWKIRLRLATDLRLWIWNILPSVQMRGNYILRPLVSPRQPRPEYSFMQSPWAWNLLIDFHLECMIDHRHRVGYSTTMTFHVFCRLCFVLRVRVNSSCVYKIWSKSPMQKYNLHKYKRHWWWGTPPCVYRYSLPILQSDNNGAHAQAAMIAHIMLVIIQHLLRVLAATSWNEPERMNWK